MSEVVDPITQILQNLLPPVIYTIIFNPVFSVRALGLFMGITFAEGFGKQLDQDVQASPWYKGLTEMNRWIVKRLLDVTHHYWLGWGLMVVTQGNSDFFFYFGLGVMIDDLPDIPYRYGLRERKEEE